MTAVAARCALALVGVLCLVAALRRTRPARDVAQVRRHSAASRTLAVLGSAVPLLRRAGLDEATLRRAALSLRSAPGTAHSGEVVTAVVAERAGWALSGLAAGLLAVVALGPGMLPVALATTAAGAVVADVRLAARAARGRRRLTADLPLGVDVLAAAGAAGMTFESALDVAASAAAEPLAGVLRRAGARVALGEPGGRALRHEADALGIPALSAIAADVERGHRLGMPLTPALHAAADRARSEGAESAARRAERAGVVATLVTATVTAPACIVALVVCVGGAFLSTGGLGW